MTGGPVTQLSDGALLERTGDREWVIWEPVTTVTGVTTKRARVRLKRWDFWQAWNPQGDVQKAHGVTATDALEAFSGDEPWGTEAGQIIDTQAEGRPRRGGPPL